MASLVRVCSGWEQQVSTGGAQSVRAGRQGRCLGLVLCLGVFVVDVASHSSGVDTCTGQETGG